MTMSIDPSRRGSPAVQTEPRALWVSLPLSLLIHAAVLTGLLIWLAEDRTAHEEPTPLSVTLVPAVAPGNILDPTADSPPVPTGATAEPNDAELPGARLEQAEPAITTTERPKVSARPPPQPARRDELSAAPPRPVARLAAEKDAVPSRSSGSGDGDGPSRSLGQNAPLAPGGTSIPSPTAIQAQIAAVEATYLAEVHRAIEAARYYPRRARRMGLQGTVALRFEILSDGKIRQARVQESSGSRMLDTAALDILERVGRFAPLPEELDRLSLAIRLPMDFHLD
jgi:protein TonB